jgi:molybdopterin-guanine dinucleotide biosynthesis protein A
MREAPEYSDAVPPRVAGFVLAGGQSTRMGRDKALLEIDGQPLVARIALLVEEAAGSAVIIGDPRRYGSLGFRAIPDRIAGLGPLGGLLTALENTTAAWNLVVACDMPGLTVAVMRRLVLAIPTAGQAQCIVPVSEQGIEPLCALYHRDCLVDVRQAITRKRLKMKDLAAELTPLQIAGFTSGVFDNVNRPAEWSTYKGST